jgi:hypothetical protein
METKIFAGVWAKAINFPSDVEISCHGIDRRGLPTHEYSGFHFTWVEVCHLFDVNDEYAKRCEEYFAEGRSVFLGSKEVILDARLID